MAPRLNLTVNPEDIKSSGFTEEEPRHALSFSLKSPSKQPLKFPNKAPWRELPAYMAFFFYISHKFLIQIPLNKKKLSLLSKTPGKRPSIFPKSGAPVETDVHFQSLT